ncbi:MAG: two component sigma-54 specific Fis family transcriptional regulator [Burkholderiales bacterium]|jgi:two-component system response regulator PilR (NtrC family)|nr:two component sigma-54 specific Fis family transcriptional regulator [Burkholderiales bacterium]
MKRAERRGSPPRGAQVLVVDDEPDIRELLELTLAKMGLGVHCAGSIAEAKERLKSERYDLCLTDMRLGDGEGLDLVRHIATLSEDLPVAVITAYGSAENAVAALKAGAFDYVSKPVGLEQLRALVKSALSLPARGEALETGSARQLLGASPPLAQVRELIGKLARTQAPVHVSGESGSGKELAARLIHENGARRDKPFVPVNCGAIPETLMESELFGYRKGAFTGASEDRDGFFQAAHGGTLFLDEIAELPLHMQVLLLRAIQERRVRKVGSTQEEPADARIICATNQSLAGMVEAGRFRRDLYYRLNVVDLTMPPLRECREDIPLIAAHVLQRLAAQNGVPVPRLSQAALEELMGYDFPGNVRELENILERAIALSAAEELGPQDLALHRIAPYEERGEAEAQAPSKEIDAPLPAYLDRLEREAILQALGKTGFNRTAAARLLGITFRQLRYRMQRLGIKEEDR